MAVLVRNCGTSLTSLAFLFSVDKYFSVLKSIDTHFIKELEVLFKDNGLSYPILEQSQYFIYLKKLKLCRILPTRKLDTLNDIAGLESLEIKFTNLSSLGHLDSNIDPKDYEIDIYSLFISFTDSLESVRINEVQLVFNYGDNDGYILEFRQIKTFSLYMINLKTPQIR